MDITVIFTTTITGIFGLITTRLMWSQGQQVKRQDAAEKRELDNRESLAELRLEVQKLSTGIALLSNQIRDLGHTPVWNPGILEPVE